MFSQRGYRMLAAIIGIVAMPTAVALVWYYITQDPTMRPLGISKAALQQYESGPPLEIVAHVSWDPLTDAQLIEPFTNALRGAFEAKGVPVRVELLATPGQATTVVYDIGVSHLGPYPKFQAVNGVVAAVEAYRMNVPFGTDTP
ncbi:hypothetical protein ACXYMP_02200 [Aliiroseovarius sp. CAU 1755]